MSSTLKILVIYLIIPPWCVNTLPTNGENKIPPGSQDDLPLPLDGVKTTLSSQEQLKKEMAPFEDLFGEFKDADSKQDKVEGKIYGKLEEIIKRAIKAENKNEMLSEDIGGLKKEKERIIRSVLKTFVVPYMCRNFELYEKVWDIGGDDNSKINTADNENTDAERLDLDTQTMSNYKHHRKVWERILTNSPHPLVQDFKRRINLLYPQLNPIMIAKNLGLAHALLLNRPNAKHGVISDEPEIVKLINPDDLIVALKVWGALKDPVILGIIKTFDQVISGL